MSWDGSPVIDFRAPGGGVRRGWYFAIETRSCKLARVSSIIRRNLALAKRSELTCFNRARPWARAAIAKLESNRIIADGVDARARAGA